MTLFAELIIDGLCLCYGVVSIAHVIRKRRRRRQIGPYDLIMIDQHTEQRRLQHANVGHKAAKGFHSVKNDDGFSRGPVK